MKSDELIRKTVHSVLDQELHYINSRPSLKGKILNRIIVSNTAASPKKAILTDESECSSKVKKYV